METMNRIKCVVVGDGRTGKTSFLIRFTKNSCPKEYIPTIFEHLTKTLIVDSKEVQLELWDTAGQEDYDRLRPLCYPNTDVVLICFSIVSPESFINAEHKWYPEIQHFCSKACIILVGTKQDLLHNKEEQNFLKCMDQSPVLYCQGKELAKKLGAFTYCECSAMTGMGVTHVFNEAVRAVFKKQSRDKSIVRCEII